jgi:hypothetical protein
MSDSLPENPLSGTLRVVRLLTGEELIGLVKDVSQHEISLRMPALMENYATKTPEGDIMEFVKLVNYLYNIKGFEILVPRNSIVYMGTPTDELTSMYEAYLILIQDNPKSAIAPNNVYGTGNQQGLELLNELFNNDDFVGFINDLMENFEAAGVDLGDDDAEEEADVESFISPEEEETPPKPPKRKKRRKTKPETNKLPYKPESPPEDPESWSDNPNDYL